MSKKNLLQESDIRRMMKFANIGALSDTFVEKLNEASMYDEQETEEGMPPDEAHGRMPHGAAMDEMAEMPEADEAEHDGGCDEDGPRRKEAEPKVVILTSRQHFIKQSKFAKNRTID